MRRFSQRNSLVTLSDLNVTPLIDLAFVLLIIFMITTPLLEQGLSLDLPDGGQPDRALKKEDVRTVEVDKAGGYMLDGEKMTLDQIEQKLVDDHRNNPNLLVYVRADHAGSYGSVVAVLNRCKQNEITRVSLRTEPELPRRLEKHGKTEAQLRGWISCISHTDNSIAVSWPGALGQTRDQGASYRSDSIGDRRPNYGTGSTGCPTNPA